MKKYILALALAFFACLGANAQFYYSGDDPSSFKWLYIKTPNYKVIYPTGLDSLARVYARALETNRAKVGLSAGYLPGETYWCTTPVVLHPLTGVANGSVAWAPMRMDLYTMPDAYRPEPMPWVNELAIHENRHVAQLQFGNDGLLKPLSYLFGEMTTGAAAGMLPSQWMLEGDAVVSETALSKFGRGRNADFLAYYMVAFDKGDFRNWEKWRWGSWRRYAPNHYALGYLTIAGARYLYKDPMFTSDYLHLAASRPLKPSKVRSWFKDHSSKNMDGAFKEIMEAFNEIWQLESKDRAPFDSPQQVSPTPSWYTSYTGLATRPDGTLLAIKSSFTKATELISISADGSETTIRPFASGTSNLACDKDGRIYWTEAISDVRWSLAADSRLRVLENGKIRDLAKGRRYFNPAVGDDYIAVTEYPKEGGSAIVIMDLEGNTQLRIPSRAGVQFVESAWIGKELIVSYISDNGTGVAMVESNGEMMVIIPATPVSIHSLKFYGDNLYMISDRGGISEVYALDTKGTFRQVTNTEYGVTAYTPTADGLWLAARRYEGNLLYKATELNPRPASLKEYHHYAIADTLSAQEKRLADAAGIDLDGEWNGEISAPRKYNKLLNGIRIHSWIPFSIDYDAVSDLSSDETFENLRLGASVLFQNTLGTFSGIASYAYDTDRRGYQGKKRHHSFHLNMTYTGLFPVFEAKIDVGERDAVQYRRKKYLLGPVSMGGVSASYMDQPLVSTEFKVYVPFDFSSGGWQRGFIPQARFCSTNDRYNKSATVYVYGNNSGDFANYPMLDHYEEDSNVLMHHLYLSARGYVMRPRAHSQVYPSLGIGAEVGYHGRLALSGLYSPDVYAYLYGYLPGLTQTQGLRLTALWQHQFKADHPENAVKTRPRGMAKDVVNNYLASIAPEQIRLTADYAIPFWTGDISCFSPVTYIKNFVFTPHVDYTFFSMDRKFSNTGDLMSVGADLTASLANIFWFPYDCELGISFNYNCGRTYNKMTNAGVPIDRTSVSFIFKTSL